MSEPLYQRPCQRQGVPSNLRGAAPLNRQGGALYLHQQACEGRQKLLPRCSLATAWAGKKRRSSFDTNKTQAGGLLKTGRQALMNFVYRRKHSAAPWGDLLWRNSSCRKLPRTASQTGEAWRLGRFPTDLNDLEAFPSFLSYTSTVGYRISFGRSLNSASLSLCPFSCPCHSVYNQKFKFTYIHTYISTYIYRPD